MYYIDRSKIKGYNPTPVRTYSKSKKSYIETKSGIRSDEGIVINIGLYSLYCDKKDIECIDYIDSYRLKKLTIVLYLRNLGDKDERAVYVNLLNELEENKDIIDLLVKKGFNHLHGGLYKKVIHVDYLGRSFKDYVDIAENISFKFLNYIEEMVEVDPDKYSYVKDGME